MVADYLIGVAKNGDVRFKTHFSNKDTHTLPYRISCAFRNLGQSSRVWTLSRSGSLGAKKQVTVDNYISNLDIANYYWDIISSGSKTMICKMSSDSTYDTYNYVMDYMRAMGPITETIDLFG